MLDPVEGRPTTKKVRLPTLPPGVKEGSIETSPQNKSKESNSGKYQTKSSGKYTRMNASSLLYYTIFFMKLY